MGDNGVNEQRGLMRLEIVLAWMSTKVYIRIVLVCAVFILVGCRNKTSVPAGLRTPPLDTAPVDTHQTVYEAEIIADTSSVNYTGNFCQLKQGLRLQILDFSSDGEEYTRFVLHKPVEGCSDRRFLTVPTAKVMVDMPTAADDPLAQAEDVEFEGVDEFYNPHHGDWTPVANANPPIKQHPSAFKHIKSFVFPLRNRVQHSYVSHGRGFGALRNWGRLHAGVDLLSDPGTEVRAVADGTILQYYEFYEGTYALEVDHKNFVVRYGEIFAKAGYKRRGKVSSGEVIAEVGLMYPSYSSMLHFEMYKGTEQGPLTQGVNHPYQRRKDLVNPTRFIQELEQRLR